MLLLALKGADGVASVLAVEVCLPAAYNTPAELTRLYTDLILDVDRDVLLGDLVATGFVLLGRYLRRN